MRRFQLFVLAAGFGILCLCLGSVAGTLEERARKSGAADVASTAGALAAGATEANPLGLAGMLLKPAALSYAASLPEDQQADAYAAISSMWSAATANNLCVIAALLTGGSFAPACIVVGMTWGAREWESSALQRELWAICRAERAYWKNPDMPCDFFNR